MLLTAGACCTARMLHGARIAPAANPPHAAAAVDRWDRQTDGRRDRRTLDRYMDPAPHAIRAASINAVTTGKNRIIISKNPNILSIGDMRVN